MAFHKASTAFLQATTATLTISPAAVGDFIVLSVATNSKTIFATGVTSANITWVQVGPPGDDITDQGLTDVLLEDDTTDLTLEGGTTFSGSTNTWSMSLFVGNVKTLGSAVSLISFNGVPSAIQVAGQEFYSDSGTWFIDVAGTYDGTGISTSPSVTPHGAGELYWTYDIDSGTAIAGSQTGWVYNVDAHGSGNAYTVAGAAGATSAIWADSGHTFAYAVMLREAPPGTGTTGAVFGGHSTGARKQATSPSTGAHLTPSASGAVGGPYPPGVGFTDEATNPMVAEDNATPITIENPAAIEGAPHTGFAFALSCTGIMEGGAPAGSPSAAISVIPSATGAIGTPGTTLLNGEDQGPLLEQDSVSQLLIESGTPSGAAASVLHITTAATGTPGSRSGAASASLAVFAATAAGARGGVRSSTPGSGVQVTPSAVGVVVGGSPTGASSAGITITPACSGVAVMLPPPFVPPPFPIGGLDVKVELSLGAACLFGNQDDPANGKPLPFLGVYRGRGGTQNPDGSTVSVPTGDTAFANIKAYENVANRPVDYVVDYMLEAPTTWAQFEGGYLTTAVQAGIWSTAAAAARRLCLAIPACAGRSIIGSGGNTWAREAAGDNDTHWKALGNYLIACGFGNAMLRIGREFNGSTYQWATTTTGDGAADYIAGYQHIVTLLRGLPGADFHYCWNPVLGAFTVGAAEVQAYYPGNGYVDSIGLDVYDQGAYSTITTPPYTRTLAQQQANWTYLETEVDGLQSWATFVTTGAAAKQAAQFPRMGPANMAGRHQLPGRLRRPVFHPQHGQHHPGRHLLRPGRASLLHARLLGRRLIRAAGGRHRNRPDFPGTAVAPAVLFQYDGMDEHHRLRVLPGRHQDNQRPARRGDRAQPVHLRANA